MLRTKILENTHLQNELKLFYLVTAGNLINDRF